MTNQFLQHIVQTVIKTVDDEPAGDVLVFLPGAREYPPAAQLTGATPCEVLPLLDYWLLNKIGSWPRRLLAAPDALYRPQMLPNQRSRFLVCGSLWMQVWTASLGYIPAAVWRDL